MAPARKLSVVPTHPYEGTIREIERLGFGFKEVAQYELANLNSAHNIDPKTKTHRKGGIQVRTSEHYAPKQIVEQYAVQMGHSPAPPIVVTNDGVVVDGNTRVAARRLRKEEMTPAFVLDVSYADATPKQKAELHALAATLNQTGGQRLTKPEIRLAAEGMIAMNWLPTQIGRALGTTNASVNLIKREIEAVKKLQHIGLNDKLVRGASLRALGSEKVVSLNDEPFKLLAQLAADAGFNATEIADTAKAVRELGSDDAAIKFLTKLRDDNESRIRENLLTGVGKPPAARVLRQHLGFLKKFVKKPKELVETAPNYTDQHVETLERAISVLTAVLNLQRKV